MTKSRLEEKLDERFEGDEGIDELRDIVKHGMSGGVGDFIYSSELYEFFEEHEDEIVDLLYDAGMPLCSLVEHDESWTLQHLREKSVWCAVELYAFNRLNNYEEEE